MSNKTEKLPKAGDRRIIEALDTAYWVQEYVMTGTAISNDGLNMSSNTYKWTNLYGPYTTLETARLAAKRGILKRVVENVVLGEEKP